MQKKPRAMAALRDISLSDLIMRKPILIAILILFINAGLNAQKGRNQLNLLAETTVPVFQNDLGFGGFVKGMYGIGQSAQLTLSAGISRFSSKKTIEQATTITRLIPVLAGYKQNFHKFYIEPQAGYGESGGKISLDGNYARPSAGAFFWAIGAGYDHKKICIGLRFQQAHGTEPASARIWHNKDFHYTAIQFGYKLL